jgi:hypothetical protein
MKTCELKELNVELISFVDKAANLRTFIYKSLSSITDAAVQKHLRTIDIKKVDDDKHLVYGIVYAPDDIDAHGDFATSDTIEKAAHGFLAKSNTTKATDTQHNLEIVDGVTIVESAIIKGEHSILEGEPDGAWFIVTKVDNDEVWKSVKDGTYTGFSLYGTAKREEVKSMIKDASAGSAQGFMEYIKKFFTKEDDTEEAVKGFDEIYNKMQLRTIADAISSAVWDVMYNDLYSIDEKISEIKQVLADADVKIDTIEIAKSEINKAGKTISAANMKKLQAAMDAMQSLMDAADTTEEKRKRFTKQELGKQGNAQGENKTMDEKVKTQKEFDDATAKAKADAEEAAKLEKEKLEKELKDAKDELEKSKGSKQVTDGDGDGQVKKAAVLPFLS